MEAEATAMMGASSDIDRLSYEIFSILESKFLFGYGDQFLFRSGQPETLLKAAIACPKASTAGKIRVLCIDEGPGIVAAVALAHLEIALAKQCGNPAARISDFFDLAAGSGTGGVLAAMLFTRAPDGRPLFSAGEALQFTLKNRRKFASSRKKGVFHRSGGIFRRVFGESTLRDAIKPVLIPCFDLATGAPFLFSRADAVEADAFDFPMRDVCAATCAGKASAEMRSVDGRTRIRAVGGVVAMRNPTAAAITHVLNNKLEFPFAAGVEDLLVVSLGGGEGVAAPPSAAELVRIASEGAVDMVDQAVALAFGQSIAASYFRIQVNFKFLFFYKIENKF
ncbi:Patatin group A-3 [Apostasia shenzhenica]|uniref:Patatin group A-3 n=1 Tax=Apostasia shenzhenica TaxID=1088818 RepID=A0A2I0B2U6_9ASPA|nr:Patatin group A-3 [Apostasia shenzhenica]